MAVEWEDRVDYYDDFESYSLGDKYINATQWGYKWLSVTPNVSRMPVGIVSYGGDKCYSLFENPSTASPEVNFSFYESKYINFTCDVGTVSNVLWSYNISFYDANELAAYFIVSDDSAADGNIDMELFNGNGISLRDVVGAGKTYITWDRHDNGTVNFQVWYYTMSTNYFDVWFTPNEGSLLDGINFDFTHIANSVKYCYIDDFNVEVSEDQNPDITFDISCIYDNVSNCAPIDGLIEFTAVSSRACGVYMRIINQTGYQASERYYADELIVHTHIRELLDHYFDDNSYGVFQIMTYDKWAENNFIFNLEDATEYGFCTYMGSVSDYYLDSNFDLYYVNQFVTFYWKAPAGKQINIRCFESGTDKTVFNISRLGTGITNVLDNMFRAYMYDNSESCLFSAEMRYSNNWTIIPDASCTFTVVKYVQSEFDWDIDKKSMKSGDSQKIFGENNYDPGYTIALDVYDPNDVRIKTWTLPQGKFEYNFVCNDIGIYTARVYKNNVEFDSKTWEVAVAFEEVEGNEYKILLGLFISLFAGIGAAAYIGAAIAFPMVAAAMGYTFSLSALGVYQLLPSDLGLGFVVVMALMIIGMWLFK